MAIEKITGLDALERAGLAVPRYRFHLEPHLFDSSGSPFGLSEWLKALGNEEIIARSASGLEDELDGGTLESFRLKACTDADELWLAIREAREKMQARANPELNLSFARAMAQGRLEAFDSEDIGVFLNELVPSHRQLTVVPIRDEGELKFSMRYLRREPFYGNLIPAHKVLAFEGDFRRAVKACGALQEMEVQESTGGERVFVQTKTVEPLLVNRKELSDKEMSMGFSKGLKTYSVMPGQLEQRQTSLVVDEVLLAVQKGFLSREDAMEEEYYSAYEKMDVLQEELLAYYKELWKMAVELPEYSFVILSTLYHYPEMSQRILDRLPVMREVKHMHEELMKNASVLLMPENTGALSGCEHFVFGTAGPKQVQVTFKPKLLNDPKALRELFSIKTGDDMTLRHRENADTSLQVHKDSSQLWYSSRFGRFGFF